MGIFEFAFGVYALHVIKGFLDKKEERKQKEVDKSNGYANNQSMHHSDWQEYK